MPPNGAVPYLYFRIQMKFHLFRSGAYKTIFQTPLSFYYLRNWHLTSIELTTSNLVCYVTIWPFICECLFPHLDHKCLKDRNRIACCNSQLKVMHTTRVWWMNGDFPEKETRATTNPFLCRSSFLIMYQTITSKFVTYALFIHKFYGFLSKLPFHNNEATVKCCLKLWEHYLGEFQDILVFWYFQVFWKASNACALKRYTGHKSIFHLFILFHSILSIHSQFHSFIFPKQKGYFCLLEKIAIWRPSAKDAVKPLSQSPNWY